ncbi:MAG TPA: polyprenyl synthetase family protein [Thermodesulfobacteriota bacterium]|nr:polyprenyl synthetase family protein [Deltaproteobacteria bacterium]HNR13033.1 polyprenyl synthetase family protein [Thermodesulfobacteriota bacterium]HNU72306.1 polyprenyl synthetase family protein [Thermodesulfobacteriota bacterium]HOC38640.1 polyprenyl synthetase family protein [Thermodesulfobacteriota bacterium]HQO77222.1 polyprenyl synthetase family protein [Thermodesulfobacteriota bacterium]
MDVEQFLTIRQRTINDALETIVPPPNTFPPTIHTAVRYSLMDGGKRIRPIMTLTAHELITGEYESVVPFACGIEMIHTYSLIHDDLPAMDDSDLRRGKPSSHKEFGEAAALLAGDALLTLAFQVMTSADLTRGLDPILVLQATNEVTRAAGMSGMIGGQMIDIETQGKRFALPVLEYIHTHKTGALIVASIRAGAILARAKEEHLDSLTHYGKNIGLAFQIADDILDMESSVDVLGKAAGSDMLAEKATYPKLLGVDESRRRACELAEKAEDALAPFGEKAEAFRHLARLIGRRALK